VTHADLIVIGGGPAGSATAIAAARGGMSVILFERTLGPVAKVCGEVLSEPGAAVAAELGCPGLDAMARFDRVRFTDIARPGQALDLALRPGARGVPRTWLDEGLLGAAARAGVEVRRGVRVARRVRRAHDWVVLGFGTGAPLAAAPRVVVATGRRATGRTPGRGTGSWVGRRADSHAVATTDGPALTMTFGEGADYAGAAVLADGRTTRTGLHRVTGGSATARRGDGDELPETGIGTPPFRLGLARSPMETDVYRVGDALAAWPPLVGDGMTAAMMSGVALGSHLSGVRGACGGDRDARRWTAAWEERHGGTLRRALLLHGIVTRRATRMPLWRLAAAFTGLADLIGSGVRLPVSGRGATTTPCIRGG
jgi:flavin-dependent dehydrogenase